MKRIVRLTESDLARIVRRVINEQDEKPIGMPNPATVDLPRPETNGQKGPLVGTLVSQLGRVNAGWNETIEFDFPMIKNSGSLPITINKIMGSSDNMIIDTKVPFTVPPKKSFPLKVRVKLKEGGTTTRPDANGVINYDVPVYIFTDKKKEIYHLYCRATIFIN